MRKLALSLAALSLVIALSAYWLLRGDDEHRANVIESSAVESPELPSSGELAAPQTDASDVAVDQRVAQSDAPPTDVVEAPLDPRLARLIVTVVDRERAHPLYFVPVFLDHGEALVQEQVVSGKIGRVGVGVPSDGDGIAHFDVEPGVSVRVFAMLPGFEPTPGSALEAPSESWTLEPLAAGAERSLEIIVGTVEGELHLLIVEEGSEVPIAGAELRLRERVVAVSDEDGRAVYDLSLDAYTSLRISAAGHGPAIVPLRFRRETADAPCVIRLRRAARITGHVNGLDSASQHELRWVVSQHELVQPGDAGRWGFSLQEESFTLPLDSAGFSDSVELPARVPLSAMFADDKQRWRLLQTEALHFEPGEVNTIDWDLDAPCAIRGRVVDDQGIGLAGERVVWKVGPSTSLFHYQGMDGVQGKVTTDELGEFAFEDMIPGRYVVGVLQLSDAEDTDAVANSALPISLGAGEVVDDLELLVSSGHFLTGVVYRPDGAPAAKVRVFAYADDKSLEFDLSDASGSFRVGPLVSGSYTVLTMVNRLQAGAPPPTHQVVIPCDPIEIRLIAGATAAGRVVDKDSGEPVDAEVGSQMSGGEHFRITANGFGTTEFRHENLRPGTYHFVAEASGGRVGILRNVELALGQTRDDLEIRVGPAGSLRCIYKGGRTDLSCRVSVGDVVLTVEAAAPSHVISARAPLGAAVVEWTVRPPNGDLLSGEVIERRTVEVRPGKPIEVVFD